MSKFFENEQIFAAAFEKYLDTVFRTAYQYLNSRQDAEDISQEVFMALLNERIFDDDNHLRAWLIRVTVNKCINFNKKFKKITKLEENCVYGEFQEQSGLKEILDKLPSMDREIIYLHYFEGYSCKETGRLIKMSEKAVIKRLSRARIKLKEYLGEE